MTRTAALAVLLGVLAPVAARAQEPVDTGQSYVIDATLDPKTHRIDAREHIRWRNDSVGPVRELYFHLYLNAFESSSTVFMRESGGQLRGVSAEGHGSIVVTGLRTPEGVDLLARSHTNLVQGDRTQMRVDLPAPVAPGESLELEVRFRAELPPVFARAGYVGDFHMVAQWFPKLARLEPDGRWATFPYHGLAEFYADYASYDVTTRVPEGWVVGATGKQVSERRERGLVARRFTANNVHDMAWATAPWFLERAFDAGAIRVRVLYPPGYEAAVEGHVDVLRTCLGRFQRLFGAYPYDTLTVIIPPRGAEGAAGMEYPTLIVSGGEWFLVPGSRVEWPDEVTAHELAHEWFYGIVGTNEVEWPMLDEGITHWATLDALSAMHGEPRSYLGWGAVTLSAFEVLRSMSVRARPEAPPPGRAAYAYSSMWDYGRSVYGRTPLVLETVRRTYGKRRFERAIGLYARRFRFRHPVPDDLFATFDEVYGAGFSARTLRPALMDGARASFRVSSVQSRSVGGRWVTDVAARRDGDLALDTWLSLSGERGEIVRIPWPHAERVLRATHAGPERVVAATVDPDRTNLLDDSVADDSMRVQGTPRPTRAIFSRIVFALQTLLSLGGP